jgi:signal transduction histidine kinase
LEPEFLKLSSLEQNRVFRLIDAIIDEASAQCYKQFVEERMQEIETLQQEQVLQNQELNRLLSLNKENFSHFAHELKNPLNSIMGYAQLLLVQYQKQAVQDDLSLNSLERVMRSSRQILHLINDALEMSRSGLNEKSLQLISVDISSAINDFVATIKPLAEGQGLQLTVDCQQAPAQITTDITYLEQIVTNLLSNAVRYTKHGYIKVSCWALPDEKWSLSVTDTGIGIAPEEQELVFEPFFRASSNTLEYKEESTGLGLAIVSRLVKCLHGKIELVSQVGEGSKFTITFPLTLSS